MQDIIDFFSCDGCDFSKIYVVVIFTSYRAEYFIVSSIEYITTYFAFS